jgi:hypothetical protein
MKCCEYYSWSLYHKPITIVNDNSKVINKLETSLTDNARVVIYNCHMFIVQEPYSQHFGFFPTYKLTQYARLLHYSMLEMLVRNQTL